LGIIVSHNRKVAIYNLASRFPALVLAVANANIGAGFLYFFILIQLALIFDAVVELLMLYLVLILNANIMFTIKFSKWLYRHFGIILPSLKDQWERDAEDIQFKLNNVHKEVDKYNKLHHTNWTSKKVVDILCK
jgi:hypothetical protein